MIDSTNSYYITYTFLFKRWENVPFEPGSERLNRTLKHRSQKHVILTLQRCESAPASRLIAIIPNHQVLGSSGWRAPPLGTILPVAAKSGRVRAWDETEARQRSSQATRAAEVFPKTKKKKESTQLSLRVRRGWAESWVYWRHSKLSWEFGSWTSFQVGLVTWLLQGNWMWVWYKGSGKICKWLELGDLSEGRMSHGHKTANLNSSFRSTCTRKRGTQ